MEFAYNNSYQTATSTLSFEALYGKSCKSSVCRDEVGERKLLGTELVQTTNEAIQKIRARMQPAQSRQKSYVDVRRKDLKFEIGDKVFLRVLNDNLSYEEKPVEFLAREVKTLRHREIAFVKVLWQNHQFKEAIWDWRMR
ncbi:uncharacterized protein LOC120079153 [Benincasa hispida]|uniref:uncharacterized protein LOC120079153 n=1 Tax=Benincasa hispida TaxID=102211 RepID=UPI0019009888|nr:uncharacterized protein LOC120079153 [Benincasa hispida]